MSTYIRTMLTKLFGKPQYRVLILGLDASGKTTILYKLKLGEVVTTIPTIGFNVENVTYKRVELTFWDVGGRDKIRALIRHYFPGTQAIMYIIDATDRERLPEATEGLHKALSEDELREIPVLIYMNKMDLNTSLTQEELIKEMRLKDVRNRPWHVQPCSATRGDGLFEGLEWLMRALNSPSDFIKTQSIEMTTEKEHTYHETNKTLQWLSQEDEDSDEEFIDKFQKHQLLSEQFDHRSLLRIIWTYLQLHDRKQTIKSVFQHLLTYIDEMNETLTYFWIQIVHYAREATKNPTNDFPGFLLMNPQLLNESEFPLVYYKRETLFGDAAKKSVVLPDVKKLPDTLPSSTPTIASNQIEDQSNEKLDDDEFLRQFEACTLTNWSHKSHVRMTWLYLMRDGRRTGVNKIFDGIKTFIANSNTTFHFTMTYFWIQMIDLAIAQSPKDLTFEEFLRRNPSLLKEDLYTEYYKKETILNNPIARQEMVLPDIKPLPTLVMSQNKK